MNINNKELEQVYIDSFEIFIEKIISSKYKERWKSLFQKGAKGWAKIDICQAWDSDFSKREKKEWNSNPEELFLFLKKNGIQSYVFYGMGHNDVYVEKYTINNISLSIQENIEGIFLFDKKWILIKNHNGEKILFANSN